MTFTRPRTSSLPDGERHIAFARNLLCLRPGGFLLAGAGPAPPSRTRPGRTTRHRPPGKFTRSDKGAPDERARPHHHRRRPGDRAWPCRATCPRCPSTSTGPTSPWCSHDRTWPDRQTTVAPQWASVDLRDGNQALVDPMDSERKLRLFRTLVDIGFKEIEVGFPSASQTDYDFQREIIEGGLIPDDVTIQVLVQCREELIERTFESLQGAKQAIVHFYNSTSTLQRRVVFGLDRPGHRRHRRQRRPAVQEVRVHAARHRHPLRVLAGELHGDRARVRRRDLRGGDGASSSPRPSGRSSSTCPTRSRCTGPTSTPTSSSGSAAPSANRDSIVLSLHPHNDRGTAVAAAELAVLAGADRVEGTLFGNGERTGNVDVVTLAMNLFSPGRRSRARLQRHRQGPPGRRVRHPDARPPAPPLRRRPRVHGLLRLPPGRHQEGLRGHRRGLRPLGGPLPAHRPEPHRPHLRGDHPGQQPVGQGRRRLRHGHRARPRPPPPAPGRVLQAGPGGHRGHRHGHPARRDVGRVLADVPARRRRGPHASAAR